MTRLFGTDGIRGIAGQWLSSQMALDFGLAVGTQIKKKWGHATVAIGRDTRVSSSMLEAVVAAGLCNAGVDVNLLGVVPTPTVSFAVLRGNFKGGIMISASHNSFEYNGLKVFKFSGEKCDDDEELELEALMQSKQYEYAGSKDIGSIYDDHTTRVEYIDFIKKRLGNLFKTLNKKPRIAIDCANGSASATARFIFCALNAEVNILNQAPNGFNINAGCGSTKTEMLKDFVLNNSCDLGLAFDGDADRCLVVDKKGCVLSGDHILLAIAKMLKREQKLKNNTLVVTNMSNLGFIEEATKLGFNVVATDVGDRYIFKKVIEIGAYLGGEDSGHLISLNDARTGDGQLTACLFLEAIEKLGLSFDDLHPQFEEYPQVFKSVCVKDKQVVLQNTEVQECIFKIKETLGNTGRVLVRASGTEPLIRILVEGKDEKLLNESSNCIAELIEERFGIN
ncbi:MAG: phosphoglucosamine mutase [Oscillospiraceae bacterium]